MDNELIKTKRKRHSKSLLNKKKKVKRREIGGNGKEKVTVIVRARTCGHGSKSRKRQYRKSRQ